MGGLIGHRCGRQAISSDQRQSRKDINLAMALKAGDPCLKQNIKPLCCGRMMTLCGLVRQTVYCKCFKCHVILSIHNNSIDNSKIAGTETLYFPEKYGDTSFTGQKFAKADSGLIDTGKLKAVNRKAVERPGLAVVLKYKMPAALAEVDYLPVRQN